jgi:H+/Cl- antiporter ClcA
MQMKLLVKWAALSAVCGLAAGLSSFVFLTGLDLVTNTRDSHQWIVGLLPVAAGLTGLAYHWLGGDSGRGNGLIFEQVRAPTGDLPKRMGLFVLVGSWITHLFGGSAGREGTAVQLASVAADQISVTMKLTAVERQRLLICAFAAAFGAAFGVPFAGTVFALEVQSYPNGHRVRRNAIGPAFISAVIGDRVVEWLGYNHRPPSWLQLTFADAASTGLLARTALAGVFFAVVAAAFCAAVKQVKGVVSSVSFPPLRPFVGGVGIVLVSAIIGTEALGMSTPLFEDSLAGRPVGSWMWLAKLVLTAITVGCAMPGGEVTPLFVIGATLGATLAGPLGIPIALLAGVGFVAVFAGAAGTPLACVLIGVELLGWQLLPLLMIGCGVSYVCSPVAGIYPATRAHRFKVWTYVGGRLLRETDRSQ